MAVSYKVLGTHLDLNKHSVSRAFIPLSERHSGEFIPPTQGSYGHAAPTLIPTKLPNGDIVWKNITSNNAWLIHDFDENGYASGQIDDGVARGQYHFQSFDRWKAAKPMNEYVIIPQTETIAVESFRDELWQAPPGQPPLRNKYVRKFYVSRINDAGRMESMLENSRQRVKRYDKTNIAEAMAEDSGETLGSIDYLVIGGLPEGAAYGIGRAKGGGIVLAIAPGLYEKAALIARELEIPVESYLEVMLAEEHRHKTRRSFDKKLGIEGRIREEEGTKGDVQVKLEELAEGAKGDPRTRYRRAQQILERQAKTMGTMKTTVWDDYRELYSNDRASLTKMLYMDALEEGYNGEAADRYVSRRLEGIRKDVEGKGTPRPESAADGEAKAGRRESKDASREDSRETATADASN